MDGSSTESKPVRESERATGDEPRGATRGLRRVRRAAIRLTVLFAALIVLGWLFNVPARIESHLLYYPSREPFMTPPGAEDVWFETEDGLRLHAWFIPAPGASPESPAPAILHVHGNAGNVSSHVDFTSFLPQCGVSVFLFDYRSYGRSEGSGMLTRRDLLEDAGAALDALLARDDVDPTRVGLLGVSLGGAVGLSLAEQRPEVRAVVSVAAFSSWRAIAIHHFGLVGRVLARPGMDAVDSAAALGDRPLMVVHGALDEIVPTAHAQTIHDAAERAGVPSRLLIADSAGHNDILIFGQEEQDAVAAFLTESLAAGAGKAAGGPGG